MYKTGDETIAVDVGPRALVITNSDRSRSVLLVVSDMRIYRERRVSMCVTSVTLVKGRMSGDGVDHPYKSNSSCWFASVWES